MKIQQLTWENSSWNIVKGPQDISPSLVMFFGGTTPQKTSSLYDALTTVFPETDIVGCSTAGEISEYDVTDEGGVAIAMEFQKTDTRSTGLVISNTDESFDAGKELAKGLIGEELRAVLVVSDGSIVNGSALVEGLRSDLPDSVFVSGGLAGDGGKFAQTGVSHNGEATPGKIVAIGFYGESLQIGWGSVGGWTPFGPTRTITKSSSNVLEELDGKPALALYKTYLGESANQLPGSALNFPIMIRPESKQEEEGLVRTILAVDEDKQTLTFAGDTPEGYSAQLMMASYESLVEGAASAAKHAAEATSMPIDGDSLVLMISCVGRKIVLGSRIEEEVEAVIEAFPAETHFAGYYSYGEISPQHAGFCELHNQTMTITYLAERV